MAIKQCAECGQPFQSRPQSPSQSYCSAPECQRERRRQWQQAKLQSDPDYQDNQARAQQAWSHRNPDYWRDYRQSHPEYVERNRVLQLGRNAKVLANPVAKMDVSNPALPCHLGFITSVWPRIQELQRWTSGRSKSECTRASACHASQLQRDDVICGD